MSGWVPVAALLAAAAVLALVPAPGSLAGHLDARPAQISAGWWQRWWRGRPGAPALRVRVVAALPVAVVAGWLAEVPAPLRLLVAAVVAAGVVLGLGQLESAEHRRERERLMACWPHTWELLACCLGAGLPLSEACRAVAAVPDDPAAEVLAGVVARIDVGMSEEQALLQLREDPMIGRMVADLARGLGSGTSMNGLLLEHADEARESHHGALQAAARAVGVRSVLPLMICYLPAFFLIGIVPVVGGAVAELLG